MQVAGPDAVQVAGPDARRGRRIFFFNLGCDRKYSMLKSDSVVFFRFFFWVLPRRCLSESGSRIGEERRRCRSAPWYEGAGIYDTWQASSTYQSVLRVYP